MAVYSPESPCQISAVRPLTSARTTPWAYKVLGFSCSFLINFTTFNWPSHRFLFHWSTSSLPPLAAILLVFMTSCPLGKPFSPAKLVVMVGEWTAWCLTGRWRPLSLADALPVFQHYTFLKCFRPLDHFSSPKMVVFDSLVQAYTCLLQRRITNLFTLP